ncbi:MAG: flagellar filament capping protein FliD [Terrimesophilobacter sp.]
MAVDGLVSNLDTTSLINSLMQIEAGPQTLLKNRVSTTQTVVTALQGLNSKVADLATLAGKTTEAGTLDFFVATSGSAGVTASAGAGTSAGSIDIVVDRLAQAQVSLSGPMTAWPDTNLTITAADGTATPVTAASTSLDDVVSAINSAKAGVAAIKVAAGKDANGVDQFRIQLTATRTGAEGAFAVSGTTAALTVFKSAQDAQVTLWGDTPITSSTNTFSNLLPGVSVAVSAVSPEPVTVTVARDDAKTGTTASALIGGVNDLLAYITTKTAVTNSTNASGAPVVSGGVFTGDSTVRDIQQRVRTAASAPVNGKSPSEFGISITRDGTMQFDAEKFSAALASDPSATQAVVQEISSRIQVVAAAASDKYDGQITAEITGQQSALKDMNNQISDWDRRLTSRRTTLERTYAALEVQLGKMNSQSSWLTSQLAALPRSSGS